MNALEKLETWLKTEPNQTEVIVIHRRDDVYVVKLEYGDRTTVPHEGLSLSDTLSAAVDQASRLPSNKRYVVEQRNLVNKPRSSMPG